MKQPALCPDKVWEMADKCFDLDPAKRPSFEDIGKEIDNAYSDDLNKNIYEAPGYENTISDAYLEPRPSASQLASRMNSVSGTEIQSMS